MLTDKRSTEVAGPFANFLSSIQQVGKNKKDSQTEYYQNEETAFVAKILAEDTKWLRFSFQYVHVNSKLSFISANK